MPEKRSVAITLLHFCTLAQPKIHPQMPQSRTLKCLRDFKDGYHMWLNKTKEPDLSCQPTSSSLETILTLTLQLIDLINLYQRV